MFKPLQGRLLAIFVLLMFEGIGLCLSIKTNEDHPKNFIKR